MNDVWYHGTSKKHWKEIQDEGVLWGRKNQRSETGRLLCRITYLATKKRIC